MLVAPSQSGLASVVASVQRNGGTARLPGPDLDLALEELGASIEVSAVRPPSTPPPPLPPLRPLFSPSVRAAW